jgi:hypothetical protein
MSDERPSSGFGRRLSTAQPEGTPTKPLPKSEPDCDPAEPVVAVEPATTVEPAERADPGIDNKRLDHRSRTLLSGKLIFGNVTISPDCVIRDLSDGGARVRVSAAIPLPASLSLMVVRDGLLFGATIVWRRGDELGLKFNSKLDLQDQVDRELRPVQAIWKALASR